MLLNKIFSFVLVMIIAGFAIPDFVNVPAIEDDPPDEIEQFLSVPQFADTLVFEERAQLFYSFLKPIVISENSYILQDRLKLIEILKKNELTLEDIIWLRDKAKFYKLKKFSHRNLEDLNYLKSRMDIIPESIVISQAAIESAYGTSGFAKKANNLFGMRTTTKSKGLKPKKVSQNSNIYV